MNNAIFKFTVIQRKYSNDNKNVKDVRFISMNISQRSLGIDNSIPTFKIAYYYYFCIIHSQRCIIINQGILPGGTLPHPPCDNIPQ